MWLGYSQSDGCVNLKKEYSGLSVMQRCRGKDLSSEIALWRGTFLDFNSIGREKKKKHIFKGIRWLRIYQRKKNGIEQHIPFLTSLYCDHLRCHLFKHFQKPNELFTTWLPLQNELCEDKRKSILNYSTKWRIHWTCSIKRLKRLAVYKYVPRPATPEMVQKLY